MIVIIVFIIVLGIIAVHFGFQSKKEQRKNKSIACIYVGDKKSVWILGNISFWGGTLEGILLLFSYNTDYLCIFLFMFLMAQWGAVEKKYKALPAWGVTDYSDISNVMVDDQKIDEVHKLDVDGKTYYLWIINDLKTQNKASEIRIESVDKTTQNR